MPSWNLITPRLATGGGLGSVADADELITAGITHVVDVTDAEDDTTFLSQAGFTGGYLYNPTADDGHHPKPVDWFARSLAFALPVFAITPSTHHPLLRVYAHCSSGINRGPSTAYAIMRALGWSGDEAAALLKAKRPEVGLAYRQDADEAITALGFA